jgi:hypothetical protein
MRRPLHARRHAPVLFLPIFADRPRQPPEVRMARPRQGFVYVGIKGHVLALDRKTGEEHWRAELKGGMGRSSSFVYVFRDPDYVFATVGGEIWCLDPKSGAIVWHNKLKGLGYGLSSVASDAMPGASAPNVSIAESQRQREAAAAAAAAS